MKEIVLGLVGLVLTIIVLSLLSALITWTLTVMANFLMQLGFLSLSCAQTFANETAKANSFIPVELLGVL